jgi:hypothetical protein
MPDILTRHLQNLRPPTQADAGWTDSVPGQAVLNRVHESANASHPFGLRRRVVGVSIGAALALAGGGVAYATISGGEPADAHQVLCLRTASLEADGAGFAVPNGTAQAAAKVCADRWDEAYPGVAKPTHFAVCVYPRNEHSTGGEVALPATPGSSDADACHRAGFVPIG